MNNLPLQGITVLEFSQYLSGPSAGLRLADMGARVIKIERPKGGDACRQLSIKNLWADDGSSLLFHTINRNKESFAADLKNPADLAMIRELIKEADVITHNFRPGVMDKVGLHYQGAKEINPKIIYAEITGYGKEGPWKDRPGQDLLLQSMSGLVYTSGNEHDDPVPFGVAIADIICGAHLVQGILGASIRRHKREVGAYIEVSLMESLLDFQFELLTTYYANRQVPKRSFISNGHPLLSAPYGLYATSDNFIAIAMVNIQKLAHALECEPLKVFTQDEAFSRRDEIKEILTQHLVTKPSDTWLEKLVGSGIWAMGVLNWSQMMEHPAYQSLQMQQEIITAEGRKIVTTRCPIRINGERLFSSVPAPQLGEHNKKIKEGLLQKA
ncbi:CoA transferase [Segetibacter sp. 3557_3]|uniref:CaiB/BaiF CoA transferase family protein n=1 Tax=Segetibacter sp. 3557_3 TaxID=2547429 RepID=UPI001058F025|nr:CaiB/BaiF CoA-transferase family protein [Segetibacter sp. 3557_3]TDH27493.1 CoA transferase [Segetibacter sp. 3557_3]